MTSSKEKTVKKALKLGLDEVVDSINGMDEEDCKAKLALLATHENETKDAQAEDDELIEAKEHVKQLSASYRETLAGLNVQRSLIGFRLEELGKA